MLAVSFRKKYFILDHPISDLTVVITVAIHVELNEHKRSCVCVMMVNVTNVGFLVISAHKHVHFLIRGHQILKTAAI